MEKSVYILFTLIVTAFAMEMTPQQSPVRSRDYIYRYMRDNICKNPADPPLKCDCLPKPENATMALCLITGKGNIPWEKFGSHPYLESVKLKSDGNSTLGRIPTQIYQYVPRLKSLEIIGDTITNIATFAFKNLTDLREVQLERNGVEVLEENAFMYLPNLTEVNLKNNKIKMIGTDVFVGISRLRKLNFSKNNITVIEDGAFRYMYKLLELYLDNNAIRDLCNNTFIGLGRLERLDLSWNRIERLTNFTFVELWNVEELYLSNNHINKITVRAFDGMSQLHVLCLEDNNIVTLPPTLFHGPRGVRNLDLRSNKMIALTEDTISPLFNNLNKKNSSLLIDGNPFVCDCHIKWMHELRAEVISEMTIKSLDAATCKPIPDNKTIMEDEKTTMREVGYPQLKLVLCIPPENLTCPEPVNTTVEVTPTSLGSNDANEGSALLSNSYFIVAVFAGVVIFLN